MTSLRDKLHDRVDAREALAAESRALTQRVVKARLGEALEQTDTVVQAMSLLAKWVAEELDALTSKAVRQGATLARGRRG